MGAWGTFWKCVAATLCVVAGIAICVFAAPAAPFLAAVVGGALISGGVSAVIAVMFNPSISWADFGKELGIGMLVGAISGGFSFGASALASRVGAAVLGYGIKLVSSCVASVVINAVTNRLAGRKWNKNIWKALLHGAITGVICMGASYLERNYVSKLFTSAADKAGMEGANSIYRKMCESRLGRFVGSLAVNVFWDTTMNGLTQFLLTGEVNWKMLAAGAVLSAGIHVARSGFTYYSEKRKANREQVKKTFEELEKTKEGNEENAKELAKDKATKKRQKEENKLIKTEKKRARQENRGNRGGEGESDPRQGADNPEGLQPLAADSPPSTSRQEAPPPAEDIPAPPPSKGDLPKCVGTVRNDETGEVYTGTNKNQRIKDANKRHANIPQHEKHFIDDPHNQDLPMRHTDENGKTTKMTSREAKATLTDQQRHTQQGACAEPHAHARMNEADAAAGRPIADPNNTTLVTTGYDGHGRAVIIPPCEQACTSMPGTHLSTRENMTNLVHDHRYRADLQTFHLPEAMRKKKDQPESSKPSDSSPSNPFAHSGETTHEPNPKNQATAKITLKEGGFVNTPDVDLQLMELLMKQEAEEEKRTQNLNRAALRYDEQHTGFGGAGSSVGVGQGRGSEVGRGSMTGSSAEDDDEDDNKTGWIERGKRKMKQITRGAKKLFTHEEEEYEGRVAKVFPILTWCGEDNKYAITNPKEWPEFPKGGVRVVGFVGPPSAGKTTLIHSLVYKNGYALSKQQVFETRLRIGVTMYLLEDDQLAFLDCCDGIDQREEGDTPSTPMGGALCELFTYLTCDQIVLSCPFIDTELQCSSLKKFAFERLQLLFHWSSMMGAYGSKHLTVLARARKPSDEFSLALAELMSEFPFIERAANEAAVDAEFMEIEEDTAMSEEEKIMKGIHKVVFLPLRYRELQKSVRDHQSHLEEFDQLERRIGQDTSFNFASVQLAEHQESLPERTTMEFEWFFLWNEINSSDSVLRVVTDVANEEQKGEDTSGISAKVESFYNKIMTYRKTLDGSAEFSSMRRKIDDHMEWVRNEGKKFERAKEEDRDSFFFLRNILRIAAILVREALWIDNTEKKAEGIDLGLHGFVFLLKSDDESSQVEAVLLRMAVNDYDVVSLLSRREVYEHYSNCWFILCRLARMGMRTAVLAFPLKTAIRELDTWDELIGDKRKIYRNMLWFVNTLLSSHVENFMQNTSTEESELRHFVLTKPRLAESLLEYEISNKKWINELVKFTIDNPTEFRVKAKEQSERPETWNERIIALRMSKQQEEQYRDVLGALNMRMLYKAIASSLANLVVRNATIYLSLRHVREGEEEIVKARIGIWRAIADMAEHDSELLKQLFESTAVTSWMIDNFLVDARVFRTQAAGAILNIVYAEHVHREREDVKAMIVRLGTMDLEQGRERIGTLDNTLRIDRRKQLLSRWTLTRLRCLVKECPETALQVLLEREIPDDELPSLFNFLSSLLVYGADGEERALSSDVYINKREAVIAKIAEIVSSANQRLTTILSQAPENRADISEPLRREAKKKLNVVSSALEFLNNIFWGFYSCDYDGCFYQPGKTVALNETSIQSTDIWKNALTIATSSFTTILQNKRSLEALLKTRSIDSNIRHLLILLWNLSATSKISFTSVLFKETEANVFSMEDMAEPEKPPIVLGIEKFSELKTKGKHLFGARNVARSAHCLSSGNEQLQFETVHTTLRGAFRKSIDEALEQLRMKKEAAEMSDRIAARLKRVFAPDVTYQIGPNNGDASRGDDGDRPSTSSTVHPMSNQPTLACSVLILNSALCEPIPKQAYKSRLPEALKETYGSPLALAMLLVMQNQSKKEEVKRIQRHFKSLRESGYKEEKCFKLRLSNEAVQSLLSLNHAEETFLALGYSVDTPTDTLRTDSNALLAVGEDIEMFLNGLDQLKLHDLFHRLDDSFSEIDVRGEEAMRRQTLPSDFFTAKDNEMQLRQLESTQIGDLPHVLRGNEAMAGVQMPYILVRVETRDGRVMQAVFNVSCPVLRVRESLAYSLMDFYDLYLANGRPLEDNHRIDEYGKHAIYIYARV